MKKLLTFVVGAAAVAGAAYWAAKYLTGCEKPQSVYPQPIPDPAEPPEAEAPADAQPEEQPDPES